MVSVFEGNIMRTWWYRVSSGADKGKRLNITLYHNTITGKRSATLEYKNIVGSVGTSSLWMESGGHTFSFTVDGKFSFIEIKRSGMMSFTYQCFVDGELVPEMTSTVSHCDKQVLSVSLNGTVTTADHTGEKITWYIVNATRLEDGVSTVVYRRFRDFAELNSWVKESLKGHHLFLSLPSLPEKCSKLLTDHNDPAFIERRCVYNCLGANGSAHGSANGIIMN
jgi:hypothetical protein